MEFRRKTKRRNNNYKKTKKTSPENNTDLILGLIAIAVVGFFAFKLIVGGFNYVSDMDFSLPKISFFGESEKDKKIKQLENRVKVLESRGQIKSNEARTIRNCLDTPDIDMVAMCLGID